MRSSSCERRPKVAPVPRLAVDRHRANQLHSELMPAPVGFHLSRQAPCKELVASQERYWNRQSPLAPPVERADSPSPRTAWTAGRWVLSNWCDMHVKRVARCRRHKPGGSRLVLIGDSILEMLALNVSYSHALKSFPVTWRKEPLHLAVGGDQSQHALWRLQQGELSSSMADDASIVYLIHIGTNNLGNYMGPGPVHSPAETHAGVHRLIEHVLDASKGRVVVTSILPRYDTPRPWVTGEWLRCTSRACGTSAGGGARRRTFLPAISEVNERLLASSDQLARKHGTSRLLYVDCGHGMRTREGQSLLYDGVHPSPAGLAMMIGCVHEAMRSRKWL